MKKIVAICLAVCLLTLGMVGCTQQPVAAEPEATPSATPVPTTEVVVPEEETDIVRLESIDFKKKSDDDPGTLLINVTHLTFIPNGELDTDYELKEGESEQLAMSKDAVIDFPMVDNLTQTVTITLDELTGEYLAYVEALENKPLFTMQKSGEEVTRLVHFYLP